MSYETITVLLLVLGPTIPVLTYVFVWALVTGHHDRLADIESDAANRADQWMADWRFWNEMRESDHPNLRNLAHNMQAFLQTTRP